MFPKGKPGLDFEYIETWDKTLQTNRHLYNFVPIFRLQLWIATDPQSLPGRAALAALADAKEVQLLLSQ